MRLGQRIMFEQDTGPQNTTRAAKRFNSMHSNVLEWVCQSADLNVIMNQTRDLLLKVV